ncbi:UNVERIFIED_CONTAM: hypothetical protein GTU68_011013 [Idotea baltica]|nr:hypothetical protein [Idotea baltica]
MKQLENQIALVTGGSRGIGKAICIELAKRGAKVYVNFSSRSDAAEQTVSEIKQAGGDAAILGFNVADAEAVTSAINEIKSNDGKIDILVNNAGVTYNGVFISGAYNCCKASAKLMMKARVGRIINISSVVAEMGNPGQAPYVASKAGLIGLTKSLAKELAVRNITVNAITPGFIQTDMTDDLSDDLKAEHLKVIPLGQYGNPEDIANAVAFLASGESKYITGQVIGINGGMYM